MITQPWVAGLVRGIVAGILIGIGAAIKAYLMEGATVEVAVLTGVGFAIPVWLGLTGYGAVDQLRANNGTINAADVPVVIQARKRDVKPETIMREMETGVVRKAA